MTGERPGWRLSLLPALALLCGCVEAKPLSPPPSDEAIARVTLPEAHLKFFLLRHAYQSSAILQHVHVLGRDAGCKAIGDAVNAAAAKHSPAFRRVVVQAHRTQVPPAELADAAEGNIDRANRIFRPFQKRIWQEVGRLQGEGLKQGQGDADSEVLAAVAAKAAQAPRPSLASEREMRELRYATIGGELCPDLKPIYEVEDS